MTMRSLRMMPMAVCLAALAAAAACLPSASQTADPHRIVVKDFMFVPAALTISTGSTVTWTNLDDEPHTVTSDAGLFKSGAMDTNESFSFRFDRAGTYRFTCSIHPRMVGTIIVQ